MEAHNERYENDDDNGIALDTREVSTCPHSAAECAIGMIVTVMMVSMLRKI